MLSFKTVVFLVLGAVNCFTENLNLDSFQLESGYGSHEELFVKSVVTNESLKLEHRVSKWKSISVDSLNYIVGLQSAGIVILEVWMDSENGVKIHSEVEDLKCQPVDTALFSQWNATTQKTDVFIVVATRGVLPELKWFRVEHETLEVIWSQPLYKNVTHISIFEMEEKNMMSVFNQRLDGQVTFELFEFEISDREFNIWSRQTIKIADTVSISSVITSGQFYFLAFPQASQEALLILKYNNTHFTHHKKIRSDGISYVTSFKSNFRSYIAMDGLNAGIYELRENEVIRKNILHTNCDGINYWLPVPVKTYRNDVLIFAQRKIYHDSHYTEVIEVILENDGTFVKHEDIPCHYFGEDSSAMNCIVNHHHNVNGATSLIFDNHLEGILIANPDGPALLYLLDVELRSVENPANAARRQLLAIRSKVEKIIQTQKQKSETRKNEILYPSKDTKASKLVEFLRNENASSAAVQYVNKTNRIGTPRKANSEQQNLDELKRRIDRIGKSLSNMKAKVDNILENESGSKFETVIFNKPVQIRGLVETDDALIKNFGENSPEDVFSDFVRKHSLNTVIGEKTFSNLHVRDLNFNKMNALEGHEIVFKGPKVTTINGNLTFKDDVLINKNLNVKSHRLNELSLDDMVNVKDVINGTLNFEHIEVEENFGVEYFNGKDMTTKQQLDLELPYNDAVEKDTLFIPGNLTVDNINGENFTEYVKHLCLRKSYCYIPATLKVLGNVVIEDSVSIGTLNGLDFPNEFVFNDTFLGQNITGFKVFPDKMTVEHLWYIGKIDGIPSDSVIITLHESQIIPGRIVFEDLKIHENLNVTGNITCMDRANCTENPLINEVDIVNSSVNFRILEVEGSIKIMNDFNDVNAKSRLEDILYKDEAEIFNISGVKQFAEGLSVFDDLEISTKSINNIPIKYIITKDTEQILDINSIDGTIDIENANVIGLFGNIDVTKLDQETVKITGEQYIPSTLLFDDNIFARKVKVYGKLNGIKTEEYVFASEGLAINASLNFDDLMTENLFINGNFSGNIEGFNISEYDESRLSYTQQQTLESKAICSVCTINDLEIKKLNNDSYDRLMLRKASSDEVLKSLKNGLLSVENLFVNGSLKLWRINEANFEAITSNAWNFETKPPESLLIRANASFESMETGMLVDNELEELADSLVYKDQEDIKLKGVKTFKNGFVVNKYIDTNRINNILLDNILRKHYAQNVESPIVISGDVVFERNVTIKELNNIPFEDMLEKFGVKNHTYIVKNTDIMFDESPNITNLHVNGFVGEKHMDELLNTVIYKNSTFHLEGEIEFNEKVQILGNLSIQNNFNEINWPDTISQIVYNGNNGFFEGPMIFLNPVYVFKNVSVDSNVFTKLLMGHNLDEWKNNAIFTDRGMIHGNFTFESAEVHEDITTDFINSVNMSAVVPLRLNQHVSKLHINNMRVFKDIPVVGFVNGLKMADIIGNTVTTDKRQTISTKVLFNKNVLVEKDLSIDSVDEYKFTDIVTTDTDQNLTATYVISKRAILESNIYVEGLINDVNITQWKTSALNTSSSVKQIIFGDWNVTRNLTFINDVKGTCEINGYRIRDIAKQVEDKRENSYAMEKALVKNHQDICKDLKFINQKIKNQVYKFNYLEYLANRRFEKPIEYVFSFKFEGQVYLLVSEKASCFAHLLVFNKTAFVPKSIIEIGNVYQAISVRDEKQFYLVTASKALKNCSVFDSNIWKLANNEFEHIKHLGHQSILQESLLRGKFYTANKKGITEYAVLSDDGETIVKEYRHWSFYEDNMAFVPRGLSTGLAMTTGKKLVKLGRDDPADDNVYFTSEPVLQGAFIQEYNSILPGRNDGEIVVLNVGTEENPKTFFAVADKEDSSVKGKLDFIKIYENIGTGKLFHKVPAYKPSSLVSLSFGNGEALLLFLENNSHLQIFEYKGIEGFKHRVSAKLEGTQLIKIPLLVDQNIEKISIGVINGKQISVLEPIMIGKKSEGNFECVMQLT